MKFTEHDEDPVILAARVVKFNQHHGPRVGDFLRVPPRDPRAPEYTRFTHDWGDVLQTGGTATGAYFFCHSGNLSYSGGLDPGIAVADLVATDERKEGRVWFFHRDVTGPGRGVNFNIECRVYTARPGADLRGLYDLRCPYHLTVCDDAMRQRHCGYRYLITKRAISETAFHTAAELHAWLQAQRIALTKPITETQSLDWLTS